MSKFDTAIKYVLEHEGGYVWHKDDPGGETNFGICRKQYPHLDIKNLTQADAIEIYRRDYWQSWMDMLPDLVACKVFDMAVNMGSRRAIKHLQQAIGVEADGLVGPKTLAAANMRGVPETMQLICAAQRAYYDSLIAKKPSLAVFKNGWHNRADWQPEVA